MPMSKCIKINKSANEIYKEEKSPIKAELLEHTNTHTHIICRYIKTNNQKTLGAHCERPASGVRCTAKCFPRSAGDYRGFSGRSFNGSSFHLKFNAFRLKSAVFRSLRDKPAFRISEPCKFNCGTGQLADSKFHRDATRQTLESTL